MGYVGRPCYVYGKGCLWLLILKSDISVLNCDVTTADAFLENLDRVDDIAIRRIGFPWKRTRRLK